MLLLPATSAERGLELQVEFQRFSQIQCRVSFSIWVFPDNKRSGAGWSLELSLCTSSHHQAESKQVSRRQVQQIMGDCVWPADRGENRRAEWILTDAGGLSAEAGVLIHQSDPCGPHIQAPLQGRTPPPLPHHPRWKMLKTPALEGATSQPQRPLCHVAQDQGQENSDRPHSSKQWTANSAPVREAI